MYDRKTESPKKAMPEVIQKLFGKTESPKKAMPEVIQKLFGSPDIHDVGAPLAGPTEDDIIYVERKRAEGGSRRRETRVKKCPRG